LTAVLDKKAALQMGVTLFVLLAHLYQEVLRETD